jgi:hypothetical protein
MIYPSKYFEGFFPFVSLLTLDGAQSQLTDIMTQLQVYKARPKTKTKKYDIYKHS